MHTIISAYKFIYLKELILLQKELQNKCTTQQIVGTIILSKEGINIAISGSKINISNFVKYLHNKPLFADIKIKYSKSSNRPYRRLCVKIKSEIITTKAEHILPYKKHVPYIETGQLQEWLKSNKDFYLLDTRNDYEYKIGTFANAIKLPINCFSEFSNAIKNHLQYLDRNKPIVIFCTGGVRTEKAGYLLFEQGFKNVYQLRNGIIGYFAEQDGYDWCGECFVFDNRVAINTKLQETQNLFCPNCLDKVAKKYHNLAAYQRVKVCGCIQK